MWNLFFFGMIFCIFGLQIKIKNMKKVILFIGVFSIIGIFSLSAQNFKYTVTSSADCTNRTISFTVPAKKVAKLMQMDLIPKWTTCNASKPAPTINWVKVTKKDVKSRSIVKPLYKKTINASGHSTESVPIQDVKLNEGTYILEIGPAPGAEATLTIFIHDN